MPGKYLDLADTASNDQKYQLVIDSDATLRLR